MAPIPMPTAADALAFLVGRVSGTLRCDSRLLRRGDGFIAWPGQVQDGRRYVAAALQAGAAACLVEREGVEAFAFDSPRIASLPGLKAACGSIADGFFGRPSQRLQVVASTGTNGKTSTAWWTAQALTALGRRCGVVGTLGIGEPPRAAPGGASPRSATPPDADPAIEPTGLTTPDPVTLQAALRRFADQGFTACALEASSIGIEEERLAATRIAVALFTNFTRDHLDYHGTMEAYWAAKRRLFHWPGLRAASINIDDEHGAQLAAELNGGALALWTSSTRAPARLRAHDIRYVDGGLAFEIEEDGHGRLPVRSRLLGAYNASNLLVVIGGLRALGVALADAAAVVPQLTPVPGRLQPVGDGIGQPAVLVDYAHTPDALEKVLQALRPLATARAGRLWCVFGCGGNRDATKRPLMGAIAHRLADRVLLTSDNPRDEPPAFILAQILAGVPGQHDVEVCEDRAEAIAQAVARADAADVVVLAGKGHEPYQEVAGVRRPFSDLEQAARALAQRRTGAAA